MPNRCKACTHESRLTIDRACVRGESNRAIAEQYGLSDSVVGRHRNNCLTRQLLKASEIKETAHADVILADVQDLKWRTLDILSKAEEADGHDTALKAIREARGLLETLGKVTGQMPEGPTVNILISAEWVQVQAVVLNALESHPQARLAVAGALRAIEAPRANAA